MESTLEIYDQTNIPLKLNFIDVQNLIFSQKNSAKSGIENIFAIESSK